MAVGWVGPRTGHRWRVEPPPPAPTFPGVERRRRLKEAVERLQASVATPLLPGDSPETFARASRPVIAALHALTVELTAAAAVGARRVDIDACIGPTVSSLRPFTAAALAILKRSDELGGSGPFEALSESVMESAEALSIDGGHADPAAAVRGREQRLTASPPTLAASLVRSFGSAGGPSLLLALYNGAGATHIMKARAAAGQLCLSVQCVDPSSHRPPEPHAGSHPRIDARGYGGRRRPARGRRRGL